MSMIYECPNCHTPQASGRTACRHCGAEFDSPVPDDAFLPDGTAPEPPPAPVMAAVPEPVVPAVEAEGTGAAVYDAPTAQEAEPIAAEPVAAGPIMQETAGKEAEPLPFQPDISTPALEVPPPPAAETLPYQSSPYPAPAQQSAPTDAGRADTAADPPAPPRQPLEKTLTRALLIAFPIVLIVVLGAVFFARSLDSGQDTAPAPLPPIAPASTSAATSASSGTPAPPYVLNGAAATTGADEDPRTRRMVGRWESKSSTSTFSMRTRRGSAAASPAKGRKGRSCGRWSRTT